MIDFFFLIIEVVIVSGYNLLLRFHFEIFCRLVYFHINTLCIAGYKPSLVSFVSELATASLTHGPFTDTNQKEAHWGTAECSQHSKGLTADLPNFIQTWYKISLLFCAADIPKASVHSCCKNTSRRTWQGEWWESCTIIWVWIMLIHYP